ncbi:uncharacterized protein LOC118193193 [Stegodyphus dumicola]|uniref:uncharacterized protein LOC118193193 n=1 Tax=Stegodyphus dumicola TaxID=202533 RepID=UPI0015AC9C08|nr:uncharacterized protein LOC118193193 [Stegodyphus dumicola]
MKSEHNRILKLLSVLLFLLPEASPVYLFAVTRPNRHSKFRNRDTNLVREMETEESLLIVYQPDSKLRSTITETPSTVSLEITSRGGANSETPEMEQQNISEDQYAVSFGDVAEEEIAEENLPRHRREKRNVQVDYKRSNHSLENRSRRGKIFLYPRDMSYDDLGKEREQIPKTFVNKLRIDIMQPESVTVRDRGSLNNVVLRVEEKIKINMGKFLSRKIKSGNQRTTWWTH